MLSKAGKVNPLKEKITVQSYQCALCMGMMFFASNKNYWKLDKCDLCGQISRVKPVERSETKGDEKELSARLASKTRGPEDTSRFRKTLKSMLGMLST